jgi:hypothetical protein
VTVAAPAGKGCRVFEDNGGVKGTEGVIRTKPLTQKMIVTEGTREVHIAPVTGTLLSTHFLECEKGKVPEALEGTWETTGTFNCPTRGATIVCEHGAITTQNTLKSKGAKSGLSGKATVTASTFPTTEATHQVSATNTSP